MDLACIVTKFSNNLVSCAHNFSAEFVESSCYDLPFLESWEQTEAMSDEKKSIKV